MNIVRAEDYHVPVMLQECLEGMQLRPEGCYVDVTFGGGGHSRAILKELQGAGMLYSFDQDPDAAARAPQQPCFTFIASNFRHLDRFMDYYDRLGQVDAILADLGVSSHHFDAMERGFSFRDETPLLDMRMNNRAGLSARDLLNSYEEEQLADVLYRYGDWSGRTETLGRTGHYVPSMHALSPRCRRSATSSLPYALPCAPTKRRSCWPASSRRCASRSTASSRPSRSSSRLRSACCAPAVASS